MAERNIIEEAEDPFSDIEEFYNDMQNTFETLSEMSYVTNSLQLILYILFIVADMSLIVIILRNPKLKTKTNTYILHHAAWHIEYMTSYTIISNFITIFNMEKYIPDWLFNIFFDIERLGFRLMLLFGLGIGVDWLLNVYNEKLGEQYKRFNTRTLHILYIIGILQGVTDYFLDIFSFWLLQYWLIQGTYYIIFLAILALNWLDKFQKSTDYRTSYAVIIATITIFVWMPLNIYGHLLNLTYGSYTLYSIVLYTFFLPEWLSCSSTLIVALLLVKMNKYFKLEFLKMFKRSGKYQGDEDQLDEAEDDDNDIQNV